MWLSLILIVLIIAVAVQLGMQGLYSALIMMVLTFCCCGAAFGSYEWVAVNWLSKWRPDYAFPLALALTFGVPLFVLRVLFDRTFRRSSLLPSMIDRIGGGICGTLSAIVLVGTFAATLQMVPIGESLLGHSRFEIRLYERTPGEADPEPPKLAKEENELVLTPDRFALAVMSMLSDGIFSGKRSFRDDNPDLIQSVGWVNTIDREVSRYAPPDSISVVRTAKVEFVYAIAKAGRQSRRRGQTAAVQGDEYAAIEPDAGRQFRMVRVKLKRAAMDARKNHYFSLRQFRLLSDDPRSDERRQFFPIAIQAEDPNHADRHVCYEFKGQRKPDVTPRTLYSPLSKKSAEDKAGDDARKTWHVVDRLYAPISENEGEVEVVFDLPDGFRPEYIEYKTAARASLTFADDGDTADADYRNTSSQPTLPTPSRSSSSRSASTDNRSSRPPGGVRKVSVRVSGSHFGSGLPITLKDYRGQRNVSITAGAMSSGHLVGYLADQAAGTDNPVSKFSVPEDKRLLQLNVGQIQARSGLGRALSFAVGNVQNYTVQGDGGQRYQMIGKYAIAEVGDEDVIEVQYYRDQAGSVGGVGKFDKIKDSNLRGDYELVLLFLVEPGVQIEYFSTGGAASRRDDLRDEDLVAPR